MTIDEGSKLVKTHKVVLEFSESEWNRVNDLFSGITEIKLAFTYLTVYGIVVSPESVTITEE